MDGLNEMGWNNPCRDPDCTFYSRYCFFCPFAFVEQYAQRLYVPTTGIYRPIFVNLTESGTKGLFLFPRGF